MCCKTCFRKQLIDKFIYVENIDLRIFVSAVWVLVEIRPTVNVLARNKYLTRNMRFICCKTYNFASSFKDNLI